MSLSGNLGFVSLDEVLRLLTRSEQQGSVVVNGENVRGRIYVTKGGVALATTYDDNSLRQHLLRSGLIDEIYMRSVESGDATLAAVAEESGGELTALLREMSVESVYQLGLKGDAFEVAEGATTPYGSPEVFDLERLLDDSRQRLNEWTEVSRTVPDLHAPLVFRTDLGDREEVQINRDGWRLLSHVGSGSTVTRLAEQLGTTDFWTARVTARLISGELLEFVKEEEPETPEEPTEWDNAWNESEEPVDPNESWWEEPAEDEDAVASDTTHEVEETEQAEVPVAEPAPEAEDAHEPHEPADEEPAAEESMIPTLSEVESSDTAEVEEDTEAFLEKVFSELESSEEEQPEAEEEPQEEGYGLLRRRRMGAIRDMTGDS